MKKTDIFSKRHIGPDANETEMMLSYIGVSSMDELINQTIPSIIRRKDEMNIADGLGEFELLRNLRNIASKNEMFRNYIGMGYYGNITPPVILRNIMENPGWYTQYTPYQAEIAQGRLEALLNYQTLICDLTGMPISNASLLDEGTSAAEAMTMLFHSKSKEKGSKFLVSNGVFPQTIDILITRSLPLGIEVVVQDPDEFLFDDSVFGLMLQYPNMDGSIANYEDLVAKAKDNNVYTVVAADLLSLVLLTPPGEWGADVVVGTSQRFGIPLGFGGPHAAFFATREEFKRDIPGRLIGVSIDANGNRALRMALQTREQHIKREKATSNICTSQVLLAVMASMYAVYHGKDGLFNIANEIHLKTSHLNTALRDLGYNVLTNSFFDTLSIEVQDITKVKNSAKAKGINFWYEKNVVRVNIDETVSELDLTDIISVFADAANKQAITHNDIYSSGLKNKPSIPVRTSSFLEHEVFNSHHSESEMLRYIKSLENKDLSLTHSMIALGSCTMKLNATTEMIPVTWPEFGNIHPFAPSEQTEGYKQIINELEDYLREITGFAGISLQPNSGAQGEYAGLMVIRQYFIDKGESHRNVALIPSSAHGTNPASAVMAGMKVIVTKCDEKGNIDVADLKSKAEEHKDNLACLMVTYPSTHGVFEESIIDICNIIHTNGGQVYMDGANMNAQVGLTSPFHIGADVCHLNLHKTFCIPHGGGGPGMGPIGVAQHLVPYLPSHPLVNISSEKGMHAISAAPWGSASILLISYIYIKMMGAKGLTEATKYAILNANYIKSRLEKHFPILYSGTNGRCAHEMIVDTRMFKQTAGVEVEDIAKRLIDYGFHAPTVSFPVAGTLMIEPTESEPKGELDRFCDALISIKQETDEIENGSSDKLDNVLKNAPHTMQTITANDWSHSYSRQKAAFPLPWVMERKFWPSVARINNSFGDRNLVCTCLPIEAYAETHN